MKKLIQVTECGSCGHYHLEDLTGNLFLDDCRNDKNRFTADDLDKKFGADGWVEVEQNEN